MSLFSLHVQRWKDCRLCSLCETRKKVVLARGTIPCDVLFIGEAPGESENVLGTPFRGPAGKLLDLILERAVPDGIRYALTNLVCCVPREDGFVTEPDDDSVRSCAPRLAELVEIATPDLIVCVGRLAKDWIDPGYKHSVSKGFSRKIPFVDITHPAAILRANVAQKGFLVQRSKATIRTAVEDMLERRRRGEFPPKQTPVLPAPSRKKTAKELEDEIPF